MKKKFLLLFTGLLVTALLVTPAYQPCFAAGKTFKFKFAHIFPPKAKHSLICQDFVNDLEQKTGGRIKTTYFGGGSLLKPSGMYKGVEKGIADMGFAHVEYTPGRFPVTEVCDLPLGYPSGWVSNHVVNDFYQKFKPAEWNNIKVLWMHASTPNVMITTKPVRTMADLKGLTIRAPGRVGDTVKALGATPVAMSIMEVYDGMSKGVIQGVNTPFETLKTFRFADVAKYTTSSWAVGNMYTFYVIMNKKKYEKLPPDLKTILDRLCGEYQEKMALMWNSVDFDGMDYALAKKVEIIHLSAAETENWKKVTTGVIENYIKDMVAKGHSEKEIRGWISYLRERIDYWTKKQIDYRLKSPTGPEGMRQ